MNTRDKIHYTTRKIDGYNLPFNFIISEREAGKSTSIWLDKAYKSFKQENKTSLVIRRRVVHITKSYIDDIQEVINKFTDDNVSFKYSQATIKEGIVDIYIEKKRFIRIVALSIDITAIKSLVLRDLKYIIFDEFICNSHFGEKYLKNEAFKFMEVYNTFQRESDNLKCYFLGNPYSYYNPYFIYFNVPTKELKRGTILSDKKSYVIECYEITEELKKYILAKNPLYQFDNSYTRYAFSGQNINDENIIIEEIIPPNYRLKYCFKNQNKYIGVYGSYEIDKNYYKYYCKFLDFKISKRRDIFAFDFDELTNGSQIISREDRFRFDNFKEAMRKRDVAFSSIECYYIVEEIYFNL